MWDVPPYFSNLLFFFISAVSVFKCNQPPFKFKNLIEYFIRCGLLPLVMTLKVTSSPIQISFGLSETVANTYTQEEIALQLDVLNNEVFLVYAIDLNVSPPNAIPATDTDAKAALSSTSSTTMRTLSNSNVLATSRLSIQGANYVDGGVGFIQSAGETYPAQMEWIGIISTNNFFVSVQGTGNLDTRSVVGRVYGARARADSATYAALVQSEILSQ